MANSKFDAACRYLADRGAFFRTVYNDSGHESVVRCRTSQPHLVCVSTDEWSAVYKDERYLDYLHVVCGELKLAMDPSRTSGLRRDSLFRIRAIMLVYTAEHLLNGEDTDVSIAYGIVNCDSAYISRARTAIRRAATASRYLAVGAGDTHYPIDAFALQHELSHLSFRNGASVSEDIRATISQALEMLETRWSDQGRPPGDLGGVLHEISRLAGKEHWWEEIWADLGALQELIRRGIGEGSPNEAAAKLNCLVDVCVLSIAASWMLTAADQIRLGREGIDADQYVAASLIFTEVRLVILGTVFTTLHAEVVKLFELGPNQNSPAAAAGDGLSGFLKPYLAVLEELFEVITDIPMEQMLPLFQGQGQLRRLADGLLLADDARCSIGIDLGWFDRD